MRPVSRIMDHEYVQQVLMFDKLPKEMICHIIVILNGGVIGDDVIPERGFKNAVFSTEKC